MDKPQVVIRFYEELNAFLRPDLRRRDSELPLTGTRTVKDFIESLGVPHTEIDLILVDGVSVDFSHHLRGGERISVYPVFESLDISGVTRLRPRPLREPRFVLDVHLGILVRKLRMLGFDCLYDPGWDDPVLARLSDSRERILLTADLGLLKRSRVRRGIYIRSREPFQQLLYVARKLDLEELFNPFSRCISCNTPLDDVSINEVRCRGAVPDEVLAAFTEYQFCKGCEKIYWRGDQFKTMEKEIDELRARLHKS